MSNVYIGSQEINGNYLGSLSSANPNFQQIPQNPLVYLNAQFQNFGSSGWVDSSGNNNNFTISASTIKYTSSYPRYIYDGYAQGPLSSDSSVVGQDSDDFTIGSWFQLKSSTSGPDNRFLFSRGWDRNTSPTFFDWSLLTNVQYDRIRAGITYTSPSLATEEVVSSITISSNKWYHCVINLKQGDFLKLYINGIERGSLDLTGKTGLRSITDTKSSWGIGRWESPITYGYTNQWVGNFAVYTRSLSGTEIARWYNATRVDYGY